jgi:uncharacterized protein YcfJ
MKYRLALGLACLGLAAPVLHAQEYGRVISSVPLIQQVAVPRQVCNQQPVVVEQPRTGAGALLGMVAGGAAGNAIGDGGGRALATIAGAIGGAMLGNRIEGGGTQVQQTTQCVTQTWYENRAVGFNVTYEYAGRQYQVQLPHDPGPTIALQVVPLGAAVPPAPAAFPAPAPLPAVPHGQLQPAPVVIGTPSAVVIRDVVTVPTGPIGFASPVFAPAPSYYYAVPPGVSFGVGYSRHRHWR